ncbi:MAG: Acyl-homoserine-lactone synthase [Candidatus Erwinia impunctatus]|nr:Acyl-homoserine-lactone synthase [Culicoides impunctatus]
MFDIYSFNYSSLSQETSEDLFMLRKNTFKDRLQWAVNCSEGKEVDEFDNEQTDYILGIQNGVILCGTRMIDMKHSNMLDGAFFSFFNNIAIPDGNYIESTRFFVDKERAGSMLGRRFPVTMMLFLSLINYARERHYDGILAVASHPMMHIIKKSGWNVTVLETGLSEKQEPVHLVLGHVDDDSLQEIKKRILRQENALDQKMNTWPLSSAQLQ